MPTFDTTCIIFRINGVRVSEHEKQFTRNSGKKIRLWNTRTYSSHCHFELFGDNMCLQSDCEMNLVQCSTDEH